MHKDGKFIIGKKEEKSLQDIVTKFGRDLGLVLPCPGSPFQKFSPVQKNSKNHQGYQDVLFASKWNS